MIGGLLGSRGVDGLHVAVRWRFKKFDDVIDLSIVPRRRVALFPCKWLVDHVHVDSQECGQIVEFFECSWGSPSEDESATVQL